MSDSNGNVDANKTADKNDPKIKYEITDLEDESFSLKEMLIPFLHMKPDRFKLPIFDDSEYKGIDKEEKKKRDAAFVKQYEFDRNKILDRQYIYLRKIHVLLYRVREYYKKNLNALVEVNAPINICGDTHGQFADLIRIFNLCGFPSKQRYMFLGDYVDRGRHSLAVIVFLFCLKLTFPNKVHLLRGNHELRAINKTYGFFNELRHHFQQNAVFLHEHFNDVFAYMPLAGCVSKRILCMHGGISPHLNTLDDIRNIPLPMELAKTHPLGCDLLWADPDATVETFEVNRVRAISHIFGKTQVEETCKKLDIDLIIRAHQVVEYGYAFFADRRLITVFSASRYQDEIANYAGVVVIDKHLAVSFTQFKPEDFEYMKPPKDKEQPTVPNELKK